MSLRHVNWITAGVIVALAAYVFVESRSFGDRSALLPTILAVTLAGLAGILFFSNLRRGAVAEHAAPFDGVPWTLWTFAVVLLIGFAFGASFVGFYESAFVFIAVLAFAMPHEFGRTWRTAGVSVLYAAAFTVLLILAFNFILRIPTPPGLLVG